MSKGEARTLANAYLMFRPPLRTTSLSYNLSCLWESGGMLHVCICLLMVNGYHVSPGKPQGLAVYIYIYIYVPYFLFCVCTLHATASSHFGSSHFQPVDCNSLMRKAAFLGERRLKDLGDQPDWEDGCGQLNEGTASVCSGGALVGGAARPGHGFWFKGMA